MHASIHFSQFLHAREGDGDDEEAKKMREVEAMYDAGMEPAMLNPQTF